MLDWKKRIEQKRNEELSREDKERATRKAQEEAKREARQRKEEEKLRAEHTKRLVKLQARYRCHICGKPSSEPSKGQESTGRFVVHHEFYSGPSEYEMRTVDDWNSPGDLERCSKCHQWTCKNCIHWGICKKCAERP